MASVHIIRRENLPAGWESEDAPYSDITLLSLCEEEAARLPLNEDEWAGLMDEPDWDESNPPRLLRQIAHSIGCQTDDLIFLVTKGDTFPLSYEDTEASLPSLLNFCVSRDILLYGIRMREEEVKNMRESLASLR